MEKIMHITVVPSEEDVVRVLSPLWVVKGEIQHTAFMLRTGETYISVNRPAVNTFEEDVVNFLENHSDFYLKEAEKAYQCAKLNVGDIRAIEVKMGDTVMDINVEVEPRDSHVESHAGIFTRFHNMNIKNGQVLKYGPTADYISADTLLLYVRYQLLQLASLESHIVTDQKK